MASVVSAVTGLTLFLRFIVPQLTNNTWKELDTELATSIRPLHHELAQNVVSPEEAGDRFNKVLQDFFTSKPDLFTEEEKNKQFIRRDNKTLIETRRQKNKLRGKAFRKTSTNDDRQKFYECLRTYEYLKKQQDKNDEKRNTNFEEKKYRSNFWTFSKSAVDDTLYDPPKHPTFTKQQADTFFKQRYENPVVIDQSKLNWFPYIPEKLSSEFDLSSITPKMIKDILRSKSSNSAPGPDGIVYGLLKKLPSTHHFIATLFSKVIQTGIPPLSWSTSKITLIHKKNETNIPSNFRMIALSNCVGKLFHQILADRFDAFIKDCACGTSIGLKQDSCLLTLHDLFNMRHNVT